MAQSPESRLPNIVFLISDDHSWPDLGCHGNSVATSPQCSPNRSSIFTGCAPHTTSTSRLHTPLPDWEPTIVDMLKQRGYHTGIYQKHHQGPGFQGRLDFYGPAKLPFDTFFAQAPKGKPFFLQIGFTDPHRPYRPGAFSPPHDPAKVSVRSFLPDRPEVRQDLAHYHDSVARMDAECGQIFDLLRKHGHADNTAVFMTGDNGMPFPRAKGTCYDPGIHVPLVAWWPGRIAAGLVNSDLVGHVDLAPRGLRSRGSKRRRRCRARACCRRCLAARVPSAKRCSPSATGMTTSIPSAPCALPGTS